MSKKPTVSRGRTGSDLPPAMQEKGQIDASREDTAHSSGRPPRIPMGNSKKLDFPEHLKEEGFYYRWIIGKEGKVAQAKAAYYEHVSDGQGNNYTRQADKYVQYLMKLPMKYREEDNLLKRKAVAATLAQEASIGANEYAPTPEGRKEGGTSAINTRESDNPYS